MKLLIRATAKKIPETTRIFVVVRDCSKLTPKLKANVTDRNTKLPMLKSIWFSLS